METFILPLLMGSSQGGSEDAMTQMLMGILPFVAIILIFYLLIIRPQNKKRKETEKMLTNLKKGDKVVTIGGLYGTVQNVRETTVILKVDDNVKLEFQRSSIASILNPSEDKKDKKDNDNEKSENKSEEKEKSEEQSSEDGE